jgi:hypothetical protein
MEVFVVRVWPQGEQLKGRVEHVSSGTAQTFDGSPALLAFLQGQREADEHARDGGGVRGCGPEDMRRAGGAAAGVLGSGIQHPG